MHVLINRIAYFYARLKNKLMIKKSLLFALLCSFITITAQNATESKSTESPKNIIEVFDALIKSSSNYNDNARGKRYKVVDRSKIPPFKQTLSDTVQHLRNQIIALKSEVNETQKTSSRLIQERDDIASTLEHTQAQKDSMNLFGAQMSKDGYNALLWGIVAGLTLLLLFFIGKFKSSNTITKQAQARLASSELEFESYRKKALEKEQKMGRLLQDERNKLSKLGKS